ncbi:glycosyltransferase [Candidatus Woesearchaeota archaeon]|nr:glycosyltransferase [Candidatus Woesearchaeota archaeon]
MNQKPLVTVLITAYNTKQAYLNQTVNSALKQDYNNLEVLVVDDGSEPKLNTFLDLNNPKLRYQYIEHKGLPHALIQGMEIAKGEYVAVLDHDDVLKPGSIKARAEKLKETNIGFVHGDVELIDEQGKVYATHRYNPLPERSDFINNVLSGAIMQFKHTAVMFRKNAVFSVGNYNPNMPREFDIDLIIRVAHKYGCQHIPEILLRYRTHSHNTSGCFNYRVSAIKYHWKVIDNHVNKKSQRIKHKAKSALVYFGKGVYETFWSKRPETLLNLLKKVK